MHDKSTTFSNGDSVEFVYSLRQDERNNWVSEYYDSRNNEEERPISLAPKFTQGRTLETPKVINTSDLARFEEVKETLDLKTKPVLRYLVKLIENGGNFTIVTEQKSMKSVLNAFIQLDQQLVSIAGNCTANVFIEFSGWATSWSA